MALNLPKPRRLIPCHRHPSQPLTPLCAPCLRERLSLLHPSSSTSAALPELRRCKTFSTDNRDILANSCEPRRRSCEVRARSTLEDLFTVDDDKGNGAAKVESMNLGLLREQEDEEECEVRDAADAKTMKEFIDLELNRTKPGAKDFKEIAGSFWIAASVFSRKLHKWKRKQKSERPDGECNRKVRGASQSEVGDYGFGRRSCDTDPRVSGDLGRASIDGSRISVDGIGKRFFDTDPRYSLDLARASIDCSGLVSRRTTTTTPAVSVIENAMATVYGFNNGSSVAEKKKTETEIVHDRRLLITEKELMSSRMKSRSIRVVEKSLKDRDCSDRSSSKKSMNWGKLFIFKGLLSGQKQHKSAVWT